MNLAQNSISFFTKHAKMSWDLRVDQWNGITWLWTKKRDLKHVSLHCKVMCESNNIKFAWKLQISNSTPSGGWEIQFNLNLQNQLDVMVLIKTLIFFYCFVTLSTSRFLGFPKSCFWGNCLYIFSMLHFYHIHMLVTALKYLVLPFEIPKD